MASFSIWHWLIVILVAVVWVWPISQILKRMGFSPWWSLLTILGPLAWIGAWIVAYIRWPIEDQRR